MAFNPYFNPYYPQPMQDNLAQLRQQQMQTMPPQQAWAIVDELMDALQVTNARMYDNVMRKMRG